MSDGGAPLSLWVACLNDALKCPDGLSILHRGRGGLWAMTANPGNVTGFDPDSDSAQREGSLQALVGCIEGESEKSSFRVSRCHDRHYQGRTGPVPCGLPGPFR